MSRYPVYRPSKDETVWVDNEEDVIFIALAEEFLARSDQIQKEPSLLERVFKWTT